MSDATDDLLAAQDGDPRAFERFVRATRSDVARFCRYVNRDGDVDDLVQETYLRALRTMGRFRADGPALRWLLVIARRVCADAVDRQVRSRRTPPVVVTLTTSDVSDEHAVLALVDSLEPAQRQAFVLTQLLGFSYDDAAAICECPIGTIRSRVARARAALVASVARAERQACRGER